MIEDSCDALGLTLRGTPTGTRADISLTSSRRLTSPPLAPVGWCASTTTTWPIASSPFDAGADVRSPTLRPQGRGDRFFSTIDGDLGTTTSSSSTSLGWNFEPSELSAAFGLVQLDKLDNLARRQRNFELTSSHFARHGDLFTLPRLTDGVETGWHMFPIIIEPDPIPVLNFAPAERHGIDTRMV